MGAASTFKKLSTTLSWFYCIAACRTNLHLTSMCHRTILENVNEYHTQKMMILLNLQCKTCLNWISSFPNARENRSWYCNLAYSKIFRFNFNKKK